MKRKYAVKKAGFVLLSVITLFCNREGFSQLVTQTFSHTGAFQTFTIPPCVGGMTLTCKGAKGGNGGPNGAGGGTSRALMTGTPGVVLYLYVGGQGSVTAGGFNGGGNGGASSSSSAGGGGGASDIRLGGQALSDRIIVAGGGGGGGGSTTYNPNPGGGGAGSAFTSASGFGGGGAGGCSSGGSGGESGGTGPNYGSGGGGGGFLSGGGGGGAPSSSTGGYGCAGSLGNGGAGGGTSFICGGATGGVNGGGGGGGGYYGGGGGMTGTGGCNGGGAGGSSWVNTTQLSGATFTAGVSSETATTAHGFIVITYSFLTTNVSATSSSSAICNGGSVTLNGQGVVTYTWLPVGTFTGSNSQNITDNPSGNTTYTVMGTNSLSCVSTNTINVIVSSSTPSISVATSTSQTCLGKSVTFTASGTALTYSWSGGITNAQSFTPTTSGTYTVTGQNGCGTSTATASISVAPLPVSVLASPTLVCANNPATLNAVASATSFVWQPFGLQGSTVVVSPSSSTVFTLTASDGTCSGTATLGISTLPTPTITALASSSNICAGASVTLTASGGVNYTWTPGNLVGSSVVVTPTVPIAFSVVGDNSVNCFGGASQPVIVNASPILTLTASDLLICEGGSTTLFATGADTYTWSNSANTASTIVTPLQTTAYNVAGTNTLTGCSTTDTITVSVFSPSVSITSNTSAICVGGSVNLNASGAGSYTWNTGSQFSGITAAPLSTSVYSVSAITTTGNLNCPSSASIQITVYDNPTVIATANRTVMCKGETVTLTATGASTYSWSTNSTSPSFTMTSQLITTTLVTVVGTNNNGCSGSASISVKINACLGIEESSITGRQLNIYPNPAKGEFRLSADAEKQVKIFNNLGQLIQAIELNGANNYSAFINSLSPGLYTLIAGGETKAYKLIVE